MSNETTSIPSAPATSPRPPQPELVDRDREHLKLLSIFWFVTAGLNALGGCFALFYIGLGAAFMAAPPQTAAASTQPGAAQPPPPEFLGGLFIVMGGCLMIFALGLAIAAFMVGKALSQRKRRTYCMVVAGITCLSVPLGTILGVFTLMVLARPSVSAMFARSSPQV